MTSLFMVVVVHYVLMIIVTMKCIPPAPIINQQKKRNNMKQFFAGLIIGAFIVAFFGMWCMAQLEQEIDNAIAVYNLKHNTYYNYFRTEIEDASRNLYGDFVTDLGLKWYSFCDGFWHLIKE